MSILKDFDFSAFDSPEFKEDSVREEIIQPILKALGYEATGSLRVVRSKKLYNPYVHIASKKRKINHYPDYLLEVAGKPYFVLDAKGLDEDILSGKNVHQVYYYAIHPEIRTSNYGLCNGKLLTIFSISDQKPVAVFNIDDIDERFDELAAYLLPIPVEADTKLKEITLDYLAFKPLDEIKGIKKQGVTRHYGVHGYFTKQSWDIVHAYINRFSKKGDLVLDPFGGTGVTAIEAMVLGRRAIHIDLNPLSIFWVKTLLAPVNLTEYAEASQSIQGKFQSLRPVSDDDIERILRDCQLPEDVRLPKGSDVPTLHKLFSRKQLAELALLRHIINEDAKGSIKDLLLLAFSGAVTKINLTYHASEGRSEGRGDSGVFRYYRYRVAPNPAFQDLAPVFERRCKRVANAVYEIQALTDRKVIDESTIVKGDATCLDFIQSESVDYIYTDPPYGKKIPYLDLSTMWNAWLGFEITEEDYEKEAIEGGSREKSKEDYSELITKSIEEMFRVLKWGRWMSFVFQHQDPRYWHLIVETAERMGFEYVGAVKQNNGQTSFKKRQNYFTVLSGQMIINFRKLRNPKVLMKAQLGMDVTDAIFNNIEAIIAKKDGATLEDIYTELVINGLELGYLDILSKEYSDLTPLLTENFDFNEETGKYHLAANNKFRSHIPLELRVRYFLMSFLKRKEREGTFPTFEDIVFNIMPLLRNGITPGDQDIRGVLEEIAEHQGSGHWRLKSTELQSRLF